MSGIDKEARRELLRLQIAGRKEAVWIAPERVVSIEACAKRPVSHVVLSVSDGRSFTVSGTKESVAAMVVTAARGDQDAIESQLRS